MSDIVETFCPQCGPNVDIDDEGCCHDCGATAIGDGVDYVQRLRAEVERQRDVVEEARKESGNHPLVHIGFYWVPCRCGLCRALLALDATGEER